MSNYTTGEIAKLCGVSVRTVQYYDRRGILVPSQLSQGGRRLYTRQDADKLKIICFLRDGGLPISSIGQLFAEPDPAAVIEVLLDQQETELLRQQAECQHQLAVVTELKRSLKRAQVFSVESIGDVAYTMKNKEKLKKVHTVLLATAIPFGIMEWSAIFLWIFQGIWWPFALYAALAVPYVVWIFQYFWQKTAYICPGCHTVFKPGKREFFFSRHTIGTRKLTCPCCGRHGFCVETIAEEENENESISE